MNQYLKNAVQNLDCHIAALTEMRNRLAEGIPGPVIGVTVFAPPPALPPPWAVQTSERARRRKENAKRA